MALTPVFNHNKTQLIIRPEAAMGTAETLTAADNDIKWIPESIGFEPDVEEWLNWYASGRHSQGQATLGKRKIGFKAQAPLLLGAAAGTAPKLGKAFKAAGQLETIVADTSVAYTPDATKDQGDGINVTAGLIFVPTQGNALMVTAKGAMANCKVMMTQSGYPLIAEFDFQAAWVGISDGSALALTSPDSGYAPNTLGAGFTMAALAQQIAKFELDFGNVLEFDEEMADAAGTGYGLAYIGTRKPTVNYDPKARLQAVDPVFARLIANTEQAWSLPTAAAAGLKYTVSGVKAQGSNLKLGKRGSMLTWDQSFHLNESTGNDAHQILQSA